MWLGEHPETSLETAKLEALLDSLPTGAAILQSGGLRYVNRAVVHLTGYELDELLGMQDLRIVAKEDRARLKQQLSRLLEGRKDACDILVRITTKQGTVRWVKLGGRHVEIAGASAVLAFAQDETERIATGEVTKSNARQFRLLAENTPVAIILHRGGDLVYANASAARLSGYSLEELRKISFWATVHPDHREVIRQRALGTNEGHDPTSSYEVKIITKSGEERWLDLMGKTVEIDGEQHVLGTGVDITQRKLAEQALRESEEIYRSLVETSPDAIIVCRLDSQVSMANQRAASMLGFGDARKLVGISAFDLVTDEDRDALRETARRVLAEGGMRGVEHRFLRRDGSTFFGEINASIIRGADWRPRAYVTIVRDVTKRKSAASALRQAAREKALILNAISERVLYVDPSFDVIWANRAGSEWLEQGHDDAVPGRCYERFHLEAPCPGCPAVEALEKEAPVSSEVSDTQGRIRSVEAYPVHDDSGSPEGLVVVSEDITDKRRVENEMLRAQKLESIGVLAGGIAHDFNNILTAILGNVCLARRAAPGQNVKVMATLDAAETAVKRAQGLTQQLLTFSKGGAPIKRLTSVSSLLVETAGLALSGTNVRASFRFEQDLWPVEADEGQIAQVISNLLINAAQAMPEGGVVHIQASNDRVQIAPESSLEPGDYVRFSVCDEGPGIPAEHVAKVFDPYFTTKTGGTGLGLSTTYAILQKHGGSIDVCNGPRGGVTFVVSLPASPGSPHPARSVSSSPLAGKGRILVMDDEAMVRDVAEDMLSSAGFEVATAAEGGEAVAMWERARSEGHPYDALIMDITVPGGMGGLEALRRLMKLDANVRAIVSSGYSTDPVMSNYEAYGFRGVVSKPYTLQEIADAVHRVLDG